MKKFFLGKYLWINLVLIILFIVVAFYGSFAYLKWFTNHGESITVPDLKKMTVSEVEDLLKSRNLGYFIMDSVYNPNLKPYEVISQTPSPGSKVKEDRKIYVTVRALHPPLTKVPDVEHKSLNSTLRVLENLGFKVGKIEYKPWKYANAVLEIQLQGERLEPGSELPLGTPIDIIVGTGAGESRVHVPNLLGLSLDEAEFVLRGYDLNLGFNRYHESVKTGRDSATAVIYKQIPAPSDNQVLRWGESVDVFLIKSDEYKTFNDSIKLVNDNY